MIYFSTTDNNIFEDKKLNRLNKTLLTTSMFPQIFFEFIRISLKTRKLKLDVREVPAHPTKRITAICIYMRPSREPQVPTQGSLTFLLYATMFPTR